jgi:hypothetical protein
MFPFVKCKVVINGEQYFLKYLLNIILMHLIANDVSVLFEATVLG